MRTLPAGFGCDETSCEYSRTRDGFDIQCAPKTQELVVATLFGKNPMVPACVPCPTDLWLVLAQMTSSDGKLNINNEVRRVVPHSPSSP